jgi:hypothetical protein
MLDQIVFGPPIDISLTNRPMLERKSLCVTLMTACEDVMHYSRHVRPGPPLSTA